MSDESQYGRNNFKCTQTMTTATLLKYMMQRQTQIKEGIVYHTENQDAYYVNRLKGKLCICQEVIELLEATKELTPTQSE